MIRVKRAAVSAISLATVVGLAAPAEAQTDRIIDTPVGWSYLFGGNSAAISNQISNGMRPFSIDETGSGTYDAVFVHNSGPYAVSGTTMVYNQTAAQLGNILTNGNLRILDLEVYDNGGQTRMSAVLVPNSGGTATPAWGWLYNVSFAEIGTWLSNNPSLRLIDLDAYRIGGTLYYSAVAVHNSGNNHQPGWWYYSGLTAAQVSSQLTTNNARLIQVDLVSPGNLITPATWAVVMVSNNPGAGWWYPSLTTQQVGDLLAQNGARLTTLKRYTNFQGQTRWAVAMVDNANPQTRRMRSYMADALTSGNYGFMLRQVNGPVLADLNANFAYEPASVMKILHATYAIRQCSIPGNGENLTTMVHNPNRCTSTNAANQCPDPWNLCNAGEEPLSDTIRWMMQISHNARTRVLEERYGRTTLNSFAQNTLGLTATQINHTLGCLCGNPFNTTSASDISGLYEKINNGTIFSGAWRDSLADLMLNLQTRGYSNYPTLSSIINQEAAQTNLTAGEIAEFRSLVQMVHKGGGYGCSGTVYKTEGGWAEIPFKTPFLGGYITTTRRYSFATFVHGSPDDPGANIAYPAKEEILREQIREALQSWDAACQTPAFTQHPASQSAPVGANVSFSATVVGTVGSVSLQWQKQGSGGTWSSLINTPGSVSGVTTGTLTLSNITATTAGNYRLAATAACGAANSNTATLTVTTPTACYANCDNSTVAPVLNVADFTCFLQRFAAGDSYANCDNSTVAPILNVADFTCFLQKFAAGCP